MSKHKLSPNQKKSLRAASNQAIITTLNTLNSTFKRELWLGKTNRYRINTLPRLVKHNDRRNDHNDDLQKYIAVSSILHCFDGWIFLGRAISALCSGDSHTSHHLAYYAELRAAMSLLAGEGIGIFNTKHYVVNDCNHCNLIPDQRNGQKKNSGTHIFSWLALEHWAGLIRSTKLLRQIITPSGIPLSTWFDGFGAGVNGVLIGSEWLKLWGLDLRIIGSDHDGRNEVSYRPNYLNYQSPVQSSDSINFVVSLWEHFQPTGNSRFEQLDRHLLRLSLRKIFLAITGNNPEDDVEGFQSRIRSMLANVNPQGLPYESWLSFLSSNGSSPILDSATLNENVTNSNRHHFSVIARASLLLRVASGAVSRILTESNITKDDVSFWWKTYGNDFGIMESNLNIENMMDLWSDIEVALNSIADLGQTHNPMSLSYYKCGQILGKELKRLEECERVSYWGLGL